MPRKLWPQNQWSTAALCSDWPSWWAAWTSWATPNQSVFWNYLWIDFNGLSFTFTFLYLWVIYIHMYFTFKIPGKLSYSETRNLTWVGGEEESSPGNPDSHQSLRITYIKSLYRRDCQNVSVPQDHWRRAVGKVQVSGAQSRIVVSFYLQNEAKGVLFWCHHRWVLPGGGLMGEP